jgi:hypothetical protein
MGSDLRTVSPDGLHGRLSGDGCRRSRRTGIAPLRTALVQDEHRSQEYQGPAEQPELSGKFARIFLKMVHRNHPEPDAGFSQRLI